MIDSHIGLRLKRYNKKKKPVGEYFYWLFVDRM